MMSHYYDTCKCKDRFDTKKLGKKIPYGFSAHFTPAQN